MATKTPLTAAELRSDLASKRDVDAVRREDIRARRASEADYRDALAEVAERTAAAKRARQERAADARDEQALAELYRRAIRSGERARLRAQILGSAEVRALRVAKVRMVTMAAGVPVLAAFAAWSTTGVQAGVVRLLGITDRSASWWTAWFVEPALIAIVGLIIVGRAVLRSAGGDTDGKADVAEWTALGLSLALNIVGGWPAHAGFWSGVGTALPHTIGPLGAAGTAFLIGLFDGYVSKARPWDDAPRLADLADGPLITPAAAPAEPTTVTEMPAPAVPAIEPVTSAAPVAVRAPRQRAPRKPDTATAVARLRTKNPEITQAEAAKRLGVTDRTIRRHWNPTPIEPTPVEPAVTSDPAAPVAA